MNFRRKVNQLRKDGGGNVTPIAAAAIALIVIIGMFMADLGIIFSSRSVAQSAADAAALACVQESFSLFTSGKKDPQALAGEAAAANGAVMKSCHISSAGDEVTVTVERKMDSLFLSKMIQAPTSVSATAAARVDVDKLMETAGIWFTDGRVDLASLAAIPPQTLSMLAKGANGGTAVVMLALQHLGKPYVYAASGPNAFDCSGLVWYVYRQLGISLPRTSYPQARSGIPVSRSELMPGDLVLFRGNGHVGIYVGGGTYIHAPYTGAVVSLTSLSRRSDLSSCRRIIR